MNTSPPLFTVESTFTIRGRMLMLVGITQDQYSSVKKGDKLSIKKPDGTIIETTCCGVDYPPSVVWIDKPKIPRYGVGVDLSLQVPTGSEVSVVQRQG